MWLSYMKGNVTSSIPGAGPCPGRKIFEKNKMDRTNHRKKNDRDENELGCMKKMK